MGRLDFFTVKKISRALAESKNCFYFVQINDSNDEEENSSIIFFSLYHSISINWTYNYICVEYTVFVRI